MSEDLQDMFRAANGQTTVSDAELPSSVRKSLNVKEHSESLARKDFKRKCENFDENVDKFTVMDFIYFFQQQAKDSGKRYTVLNLKKDMGIFKKLKDNYSNVEICNMIKFLFNSGQTYISASFLQPSILISGWGNRIYSDSCEWVNGTYSLGKSSSPAKTRNYEREWQGTKKRNVLGDWGV